MCVGVCVCVCACARACELACVRVCLRNRVGKGTRVRRGGGEGKGGGGGGSLAFVPRKNCVIFMSRSCTELQPLSRICVCVRLCELVCVCLCKRVQPTRRSAGTSPCPKGDGSRTCGSARNRPTLCVCARACVCACVCACVRVRVCACVCACSRGAQLERRDVRRFVEDIPVRQPYSRRCCVRHSLPQQPQPCNAAATRLQRGCNAAVTRL